MRLLASCLILICATPHLFSQAVTLFDKPATPAEAASPSFSDPQQYNSYDFYGSPLGLFDRDSLKFRINLGTRVIRWNAPGNADSLRTRYTGYQVPDLLVGVPSVFYIRAYYLPVHLQSDYSLLDVAEIIPPTTLPLQSFGLTIAGQSLSGLLQFAFQAKAYLGDATNDANQNTRMYWGCDDLSLTIGSRLHDLIAVGMNGGVRAQFDSLRNYSILPWPDRCFSGQLPRLGWYIDLGSEGFPVRSDFSLNTATHRFVYVTGDNEDQDPIKGDSLAWKWQSVGDIPVMHSNALRPSFLLGFWRNHYQRFEPTEGNDDLSVGPKRDGMDWTISDFYFGFGAAASVQSLLSLWAEYTHASMELNYGDFWPNQSDKSQGYHHTTIGIEANIHAIPALRLPSSIEMFVRMSYLNLTCNNRIDAFQATEFGTLLPVTTLSRAYRYLPALGFGWGETERISGIVIGTGSTLLNRSVTLDAHLGFLGRSLDVEKSGLVFGMNAGYILR